MNRIFSYNYISQKIFRFPQISFAKVLNNLLNCSFAKMENGHFYTPIKILFLFLNVCTQLFLQNDIPMATNSSSKHRNCKITIFLNIFSYFIFNRIPDTIIFKPSNNLYSTKTFECNKYQTSSNFKSFEFCNCIRKE